MSPVSSSEKGSGTAMDWSRFSTPRRVRSPARGGVTASRTGPLFSLPVPKKISLGFSFIALFLPFAESL